MILKMNNKDDNFYFYLGRVFGSRIIQSITNDRIYDDNNKTWYVYVDEHKATAFISICNNVIKNIYSTNDLHLKLLMEELSKDFVIKSSVVTNLYENVYIGCNLNVNKSINYKNFLIIEGVTPCRKLVFLF